MAREYRYGVDVARVDSEPRSPTTRRGGAAKFATTARAVAKMTKVRRRVINLHCLSMQQRAAVLLCDSRLARKLALAFSVSCPDPAPLLLLRAFTRRLGSDCVILTACVPTCLSLLARTCVGRGQGEGESESRGADLAASADRGEETNAEAARAAARTESVSQNA